MEKHTPSHLAKPDRPRRTGLLIVGGLAGLAVCAFLICCALAAFGGRFSPNYRIDTVSVGGMTADEAARAVEAELAARTFSVYLDSREGEPFAVLSAEELALVSADGASVSAAVADAYSAHRPDGFFAGGVSYIRTLITGGKYAGDLLPDGAAACAAAAQRVADAARIDPVDGSYTASVENSAVSVRIATDGRRIDPEVLAAALLTVRPLPADEDRAVVIATESVPADPVTALEIYSDIHSLVKNAWFDRETQSLQDDVTGVTFDLLAVQQQLTSAAPGSAVTFPLTVTYPTVTNEMMEPVLFRDKLATYTTKVDGTVGRRTNVRLSAKAINGFVLNAGEEFSYNEVVGRRTAARGYQPAPAYVNGETVDEIGGGICQTSSTLYMSCLLANLEISMRRPHRYATAYMPLGMDATVSWGGPDYKFINNTDYPIRIETKYENDRVTVTLYGTKTDDITVKMTYDHLDTIQWETDYIDDPTLAPGTEVVKTSAYTGYKVQTYRSLYDGDGKLISKTKEAYSYYKARNRVVLRGPALPEPPAEPEVPVVDPIPLPGEGTSDMPSDTPIVPDEVLPPA